MIFYIRISFIKSVLEIHIKWWGAWLLIVQFLKNIGVPSNLESFTWSVATPRHKVLWASQDTTSPPRDNILP